MTAPHLQPVIHRFRRTLDAHGIEVLLPPVRHHLEEEELLRWVGDVDGVLCGDDAFTERVLRAAPRLRVISKWGVGVDAIDREACRRAGIVVRNTPLALRDPVADTVLGYVLCFARQLPWLDRRMKAGVWERLPARALRECALAVIGLGSIGRSVARRAAAFQMRLLGSDVVPPPAEFLAETGLTLVGLEEALSAADFVSLNCDLNPTTYHLIGARQLALMKPGAVLINTARGALIDEPALVEALRQGRLGGAALDVYEVEPLQAESPLRLMDRVLLGPHAANHSPAAWEQVHEEAVRNLVEELERAG